MIYILIGETFDHVYCHLSTSTEMKYAAANFDQIYSGYKRLILYLFDPRGETVMRLQERMQ